MFLCLCLSVPKDLIIKTAAIASSTVAAVAIIFLAFKFTHCCLPCRKRCCPDHSDPEASPPRELRPLTPVPPSAADGREDNWRNEERDRNNAVARQTSRPPNLTLGHYEVEDDGQISPPPDEPPPSYDSIFADTEQGNKASWTVEGVADLFVACLSQIQLKRNIWVYFRLASPNLFFLSWG